MIRLVFGVFLLILGSACGISIFIGAVSRDTVTGPVIPRLSTLWALGILSYVGGLLILDIISIPFLSN